MEDRLRKKASKIRRPQKDYWLIADKRRQIN